MTVTGATRLAAVIGDPVRHSLSPTFHNAAFRAAGLDWVYVAFEVTPEQLPAAVAAVPALGIAGLSVTMPHKSAVIPLLDEVTPAAQALDAVNCIVARDGRLLGDNTDGAGFVAGLRRDAGLDPAGRSAVVLGAGGAARAVIRGLADAGASSVIVVNRSVDRAEHAAALAGAAGRVGTVDDVGDVDLVVNATSVGMAPDVEATPLDVQRLVEGQVVVDIVYEPAETRLLREARARGVEAHNGVSMLLHQAALAFEIWTGEDAPVAAMAAAVPGLGGSG